MDEETKARRAKYKEYHAKYMERPENRAAHYARTQKYRYEQPEKTMLNTARARAKAKQLEFDIDVSDIVIPEVCPILLLPLKRGKGHVTKGSPVLDRVNNQYGYVKGNVAVISHRANVLKGDMTVEEIQRLLDYAKKGLTWAQTH